MHGTYVRENDHPHCGGLFFTFQAGPGYAADPSRKPFAGIISAPTPEAVSAGVEILEQGGNAIDAAVAVSFALAVTEPAGSGLGGQVFFIIHVPHQSPFVINGSSLSPLAIPDRVKSGDLEGVRASTIPSAVRVLDYAWRKYGSGRIPWKRLLQPAIRFAEEGYILGQFRYLSLLLYAHRLREDPAAARLFLGPDHAPLPMRSMVKQPVLARTLKRLANEGAMDFYRGKIAAEIGSHMKAHQSWITLEDLKNFPEPETVPALRGTYRGWDVYTLTPPTGGWEVLQSLNILEQAPQSELNKETDDRSIWLAEALRITLKNRRRAPVSDLENYEEHVSIKISKERARNLMKWVDRPGSGETTHFSVVDRNETAVGVTQSLNAYFGAKMAHPKLGFLYNNYMTEFKRNRPKDPFCLRPCAVPFSSMAATILARDGKPALVLGSPGSRRIISAVVQVISHWVDIENGIDSAVDAPRLHVEPGDRLYLEPRQIRIPPSLLLRMERRGYHIVRPLSSLYQGNLNPYFGGVHAVARESAGWQGAADPRRDGTVGYAWIR